MKVSLIYFQIKNFDKRRQAGTDSHFTLVITRLFYKHLKFLYRAKMLRPLWFFQKALLRTSVLDVNFHFRYLTRLTPSIQIIRRFVYRHLKFHYTINQIFFPFMKGLREFIKPAGFLAKCSGRFTRRQRATFRSYQLGNVPKNTISSPIEYVVVTKPLKYGVGTVKLYFHVHYMWTRNKRLPKIRKRKFYKERRIMRRRRYFLYRY